MPAQHTALAVAAAEDREGFFLPWTSGRVAALMGVIQGPDTLMLKGLDAGGELKDFQTLGDVRSRPPAGNKLKGEYLIYYKHLQASEPSLFPAHPTHSYVKTFGSVAGGGAKAIQTKQGCPACRSPPHPDRLECVRERGISARPRAQSRPSDG